MPEGLLAQEYLTLFEQTAPFDEFQNFGIDPDRDELFDDFDDEEDLSQLDLDD
jgi:hypothetical protein